MEATLTGPAGRMTLGPGTLTIGRRPDNQLVLTDPKASSYHAEITWDGQNYTITDLKSMNHTFVNDQQLAPKVPRLLRSGDMIRIGDVVFSYYSSTIEPTVSAKPFVAPTRDYVPTVSAAPPTIYPQNAQKPILIRTAPGPVRTPAPNRTWLWITLGVLVIAAVVGAFFFFTRPTNSNSSPTSHPSPTVNPSTPAKTLDAFCNALQHADYPAAYNQLSDNAKRQEGSEANFAGTFANVTCTHGPVTESGNMATAPATLTKNSPIGPASQNQTVILVQDSAGTWKIDNLSNT